MNEKDEMKLVKKVEDKILAAVLGYQDYIIMSAMTLALARLLIWSNKNNDGQTLEESLDLMDKQLRLAVGTVEEKKRTLS